MPEPAASPTTAAPRRYRFAPLDQTGWVLGLNASQCLTLAGGLLAAGITLQATGSAAAAALWAVVALAVAFTRWQGRHAHEWIPPITGWLRVGRRGRRWHMPLPELLGQRARALPPCLTGITLTEAPTDQPGLRAHGMGIATNGPFASATLRVRGREFALLEPADQERLLDGWGSALAAFARERSPIVRVSWSEWAAPATLDDHLAFVHEHHPDPTRPDIANYLDLVRAAGPMTTTHEALITLTLDRRRLVDVHGDLHTRVHDTLTEEIRLLAARLERAHLHVDGPLSGAQLAGITRRRLDPAAASTTLTAGEEGASLGEQAGIVAPTRWAPLAMATDWHHVHADGAWHRSYWIREWPRLDVRADWLTSVVLHPGGSRTLTVVYEPVAPSRSRRMVDRDATRLASDEDQRTRHGFRIRAQHRRAEQDVLQREAELVNGYAELTYAGFLTITAPDLETLRRQARDWEQACTGAGIELRALDGQHDLAVALTLPLGQPVAARR